MAVKGRKGLISRHAETIDRGILVTLFFLLGVGLVQVYSSSFIFATEKYGNGRFFFNKQLIFTFSGIAVLFITAYFPWRIFKKYCILLWVFSIVLLVGTFVPGLMVKAGGAIRWIRLPFGFQFEPAELIKVTLPVTIAILLTRKTEILGRFEPVLKFVFVGVPLLLFLKQPDFGSFVICLSVALVLFFVHGLSLKVIFSSLAIAIPTLVSLVLVSPYRKARLMAFFDPWSDPTQKGFQVIQSLMSFHSGGLTGVGMGQSQGKLFFLPEAHTDFTLAVLGEELGFIGFVAVLTLYGFLIFRGIQISLKLTDEFSRLLVVGITVMFALSVSINVGVVLGMLPTKGLTLPFLSYGGSSLLMTCFAFGIILNAQRQISLQANTALKGVKIQKHDSKYKKKKQNFRDWK